MFKLHNLYVMNTNYSLKNDTTNQNIITFYYNYLFFNSFKSYNKP